MSDKYTKVSYEQVSKQREWAAKAMHGQPDEFVIAIKPVVETIEKKAKRWINNITAGQFDRLGTPCSSIVTIYTAGYMDGFEEGLAAGKAEAFGDGFVGRHLRKAFGYERQSEDKG